MPVLSAGVLSTEAQKTKPQEDDATMRKLLGSLTGVIVLAALGYGYLLWQNNRAVAAPDASRLESALDRSIGWLEHNQHSILETFNPML